MARRGIPSKATWTKQIFRAAAVGNGGVVRRAVADVRLFGSVSFLKREVKRRKFHLLRAGDQFVVLCNPGDLRIVC